MAPLVDEDWLTWAEAAELVGCPVPTIDWHKRTGRIVSRGPARRSLQRESVEEFAAWWRGREERRAAARARAGRRETGRGWQPPDLEGWISTTVAGELLGVTPKEISYLVSTGTLPGTKASGRVWLRLVDVEAHLVEEARWMTQKRAAELVGVSEATIVRMARAGELVRRSGPRRWASLERASVERVAAARVAAREERARKAAGRPPDDGGVWLDATTAGLVLGLSARRVHQLASQDRVPFTLHGGRRWFLREHVEQFAAARAARTAGKV